MNPRSRGLPVAALLGLVLSGTTAADVLHLKDGRKIRVEEWTETETEYVYSRFGGTVAIAKAEVIRVERTAAEGASSTDRPARPGEPRSLPLPDPSAPAPRDAGANPAVASEFALGEAARLREDFETAVRHYESALRIDPAHLGAGTYRTACYLWLEQLPFALAAAQEARMHHPEDPTLWFLLGEIHYLQDRLPEALRAWEESARRRDHPAVRARIEKVRRELSTEAEYDRVAGGRFRVRFAGGEGSGDLPRRVLEYLEERVGDLSLELDHFPSAPLSVILYPEQDFHDATLTPHSVRGVFDGKIRIPLGGETRITKPLRNTLDHELTHALIDSKTGGNCPRWIHEGIAQYVAGDRSGAFREALAGQYRRLSASGEWHPGISYPAALDFVEFLTDRHGFSAWLRILDRMREGASFEDALFATLRMRPREAFEAWGEALLEATGESR